MNIDKLSVEDKKSAFEHMQRNWGAIVAAAQRDAAIKAANEQTIAQTTPDLLQLQAERIAELEDKLARCNAHLSNCQDSSNYIGMENEELKAQVAALQAVAVAVMEVYYQCQQEGDMILTPAKEFNAMLDAVAAAGYLPAKGVAS